ncbi:hypothetical protein OU798_07445 [Prolixibacteraceae bacterium Z1-6]|uniref:Uncharacterized protein n=1 Tax=Draconibacterium aestuarii TaxID=2998507 RepID=A0A9X3F3Z9_9BACT|nr:hypothetical protein [Prolixibacteraceae bacterium Z1-6]
MLINSSKIIEAQKPVVQPETEGQQAAGLTTENGAGIFADAPDQLVTRVIGKLEQGKTIHYYSYGNFNLVRLILYIIKQTGPVHCFMTSYSISQKSIETVLKRIEQQELLSFRVLIDNRVRSMSPKPFQMLSTVFDYRCSSIHAKVALLWNNDWKISVVTSQNATDNPKMERGTIFTDPTIFEFDLKALENEFKRGTT